MQADPEVVQVAAQLQLVFAAREPVLLADLQVLRQGEVVPRVPFERLAHPLPGGGQRHADVRQALQLPADGLDRAVEPAVVVEVDGQHAPQVGEARPQAAGIDVPRPVLLLVLHDEQRAAVAQHLHRVQPVREIRVLLPVVADEDIDGAPGQEELVRGMVRSPARRSPRC